MTQEIAIWCIGALVVLYLLNKIFPCLFRKKRQPTGSDKKSPCDSCPGCPLKNLKSKD